MCNLKAQRVVDLTKVGKALETLGLETLPEVR
jgi:hypothetical protein